MSKKVPTAPSTDKVTVPDTHPFAAQIAAIEQLPEEMMTDLVKVQTYIAEVLHETEPDPMAKIAYVIDLIGTQKALKFLIKTLKTEGEGGLLIFNQSRRRTIGGVYFYLTRHWLKPLLPALIPPKKFSGQPTFKWADHVVLFQEAVKEMGEANIPRLTVMGRPGKIIEKGQVVLTTLPPKPQPKSLPQGLPRLPAEPATPYVLYISAKQWRKVKEALFNKEDELIIEGYPAFNPQLKAMTVFAINTTTKLQEQSRRKK